MKFDHRPDLDGLRGLAIALVLIEHFGVPAGGGGQFLPFSPGMAGVTTFFVLSGFLISSLLMAERSIDKRNFYLRRILRLGPALVVLLGFTTVVGIIGLSNPDPWIPGVLGSLLYASNWMHIAGIDLGLLDHTWSLAIEEQFYLVWPLAMVLVPRRALLPVAVAGAIAGCTLYALDIGPTYHSSLTNAGGLLAGCAVALLARQLPALAGLVGVALIIAAALFWSQAAAVAGSLLVIAGPVRVLLPLAPLGRRAYGLYLWSLPLVLLFGGVVALPLTLVAADLSYRLVEGPITRRFHHRLRPRTPAPLGPDLAPRPAPA